MSANRVWSKPFCDLCADRHVGAPCLEDGAAIRKIVAWNEDCDQADLNARRRFKKDIGRVQTLGYLIEHRREL